MYHTLLKFRESVEAHLPEHVRIVHHFFMPAPMSGVKCGRCDLIGDKTTVALLAYILQDTTGATPMRIYSTCECPVCHATQTARFDVGLDDAEMLAYLGCIVAAPDEEVAPTEQ